MSDELILWAFAFGEWQPFQHGPDAEGVRESGAPLVEWDARVDRWRARCGVASASFGDLDTARAWVEDYESAMRRRWL